VQAGGLAIEDLEALRVPLTGYCYRLLGSWSDTEDAVQETLIRASSKRDRYDPGRARLSTWVHRIATNVCIDMLRAAKRRALVVDAAAGHHWDLGAPLPAEVWVEPMPDSRLLAGRDPGEVVLERESVRLAFVAALQRLAPRQRAVLVLRDVLGFTAQETAGILDTTVPAVHSALRRARASLDANRPDPFDLCDPEDAGQRDLLRRYVTSFESHDIAGLTAVLRGRRGGDAAVPVAAGRRPADRGGHRGQRLLRGRAAGAMPHQRRPGVRQYRPGGGGDLRPFALVSVDTREEQITRLVTFLGTQHRFAEFGLPASLRAGQFTG
jgi:RNA polymerase sigma-70 factor (TIGR02960 family)